MIDNENISIKPGSIKLMRGILLITGILSALLLSSLPVYSACKNFNPAMQPSTPEADFIIHNDGTVTHRLTGLMWMRCSLGQVWRNNTCSEEAYLYSWQNALNAVVSFNSIGGFAGHDDWRLPNKNEIVSIVEERCWDPAINRRVFPNTPSTWFWSSTPNIFHAHSTWSVGFYNGYVDWLPKNDEGHVRLVRTAR